MPDPIEFSERELTPSQVVARNAAKGLELREKFGRGGTEVGKRRAQQLKAREPIDMADMKSMYSYFARHDIDRRARRWGDDENPSAGWVAWLLWGGDEAREWVGGLRAKYHGEDR